MTIHVNMIILAPAVHASPKSSACMDSGSSIIIIHIHHSIYIAMIQD